MNDASGGRANIWREPASWPRPARWAGLLAVSTLVALLWNACRLPAALLLGPMIGGIVFGANGVKLAVPRWPYLGAQAVIGALVAGVINPAIAATLGHHLVLFAGVTMSTLVGAALIGWSISRSGLIPGTTAVYGISPGAATAMVVLSEAEGADSRLVAFMQYSRVLLVALAAAIVARLWVGASHVHTSNTPWFGDLNWVNLAQVLLLAALGQQLARLLRLQAWPVLGPMLLLGALHAGGWLEIELPRWFLAFAYALIGWQIGLGFHRDALRHARQALPMVVGASLGLMALCGVLAWFLATIAHVDALTAYLATSPGGLDSVAIIAASAPRVDLPFVIALQSVRLLLVIGVAPAIARLVVRHSPHLRSSHTLG